MSIEEMIVKIRAAKPLFTEEQRAACRASLQHVKHVIQYPASLQEDAMTQPKAMETKGS